MGKSSGDLDGDDTLAGRRHSPPPSETDSVLANAPGLSDFELQEKIERITKSFSSGIAAKLPDKGQRFRANLLGYCNERDRRDLARIQKVVPECHKTAGGISQLEGAGLNIASTESSRQGKLEDKTDGAFSQELSLIGRHKHKGSDKIGSRVTKERQPLQKSEKPDSVSARDHPQKDKRRLTQISSSQAEKNLSRRLSQRRRVAAHRGSAFMDFEEVQHVVLVDDETQSTQSALGIEASNDWDHKMYYPSRGHQECVELSLSDLKCLDPESYLSSPIMNFYIQYLQTRSSFRARNEKCYIFNTFFYNKLEEALTSKDSRTASFLKLRRWWKGVDIFQKAYIFLPIHGDMHWSLAIICIPDKEDESGLIILHLDSLGLHGSSHIFSIVARYLKEEWNYINQNALPSELPISERTWNYLPRRIEKEKITVPQQKNDYDCGLFVLYFMKRFIEEAPERFIKKDLTKFNRKWFRPEEASAFRTELKGLVTKVIEDDMLKYGDQELQALYCENGEEEQL